MNGSMHQEYLSMPGSDRFIETYVSAVDSAAHFWLQVNILVVSEIVFFFSSSLDACIMNYENNCLCSSDLMNSTKGYTKK